MERRAKDGTFYRQIGEDQWEPVTRKAKDGTVYKKIGEDDWEPMQQALPSAPTPIAQESQQVTPKEEPIQEPVQQEGSWLKALISGKEEDLTPEAQQTIKAAQTGLEQGVSFNLADEAKAALSAPLGAVKTAANFLGAGFDDESTQAYKAERDALRAEQERLAQESPYAYKGSELFGSILSGLGTGAAGAAKMGISSVGNLGTKAGLSNLGKMGILSGAEGATMALGQSEAETGADLAKDVETGGVVGAAFAPLGALGSRAVSKLGAAGTLGAASGGYLGYEATPEDAPLSEKVSNTVLSGLAGAGTAMGVSRGLGKLTDISDTLKLTKKFGAEDFRRGLKGESIGTLESVQKAKTALEESSKPLAEKIAKTADAAELKLKRAEADLLKSRTRATQSATEQQRNAINKEVQKKGTELADLIKTSKDKFGKTIEDTYDTLDNQGVTFDLNDTIDTLKGKLSDAQAITGESGAPFLQEAQKQLTDLQSEFGKDVNDIRRLKATIFELADRSPDPNTKRLLMEGYSNANNALADQLKQQGFENLGDVLSNANRSYSSAVTLDLRTGGKRTAKDIAGDRAARATGVIEQLGSKSAKVQQQTSNLQDALRNIAPERADSLIEEASSLVQKRQQLKPMSAEELKLAMDEELSSLAEKALSKEEMAAMNLEMPEFFGKQVRQIGKPVEPSKGLTDFLALSQEGDASRVNPIQANLKDLLGKESEPTLKKAQDAAKELYYQASAANKEIRSATLAPGSQMLAMLGGGLGGLRKASNVAGQVIGFPVRSAVNMLESAGGEQVMQAANIMRQAAPQAAQKLEQLAGTTDPVKRKAILFLISQDPQFRKAMSEDQNEQKTEGEEQNEQ